MKKGGESRVKKRLFDFSPSTAATVAASYALLIALAAFTLRSGGNPAIFLTALVLLIVSFVFVFVYFVILAPRMSKKGLSHGAKTIKLKNLKYKAIYDVRFKEKAIIFYDKRTDIKHLDPRDYKKKTIRVQATAANVKKIEEWLCCTINVPEKPPRRPIFGRKK